MSYQNYKYDAPKSGSGQYTSYTYSSSSGTGGPGGASYSSPFTNEYSRPGVHGVGQGGLGADKYSYTGVQQFGTSPAKDHSTYSYTTNVKGGDISSYGRGGDTSFGKGEDIGYGKGGNNSDNSYGKTNVSAGGVSGYGFVASKGGQSQAGSTVPKKDDYYLADKLITKTDAKALLPEFSGEGNYGYISVEMSGKSKEDPSHIRISKANPKDSSDLLQKYGNLNADEISQKGNLGKVLYGNAVQFASHDAEFEKVIESCERKKTPYADPDFPTAKQTLSGGDRDFDNRCYGHKWLRPKEIFKGSVKIFEGKIEPRDIKQGILGDCYFLSSCASLAEKDDRIKKVFVSTNDGSCQKNGAYCVKICERGIWKSIVIDDLFPCDSRGETLFTNGNQSELWVLILEKAWAKNYGSYFQIEAGLTRESMHDLTGAPCVTLFVDERNKEVLWKEVEKGERMNFAMTTGSLDEETGADLKGVGLAEGHAYSMLGAYYVQSSSGKEELVKLRNPWGKFEWSGKWNDKDSKWNSVSQSEKSRIGYSIEDDGIFFMDYKDYIHYFDAAQICYVHDDYQYNAVEVSSKCDEEKYFKVTITKPGHHVFSVSQFSIRHLTLDEQDNHKYAKVVLKVGNEKGEVVTDVNKNDREVFTGYKRDQGLDESITFQPGVYYVYVKVSWISGRSDKFGLSCYGVGEAKFEPCTAQEAKNIGTKSSSSGGAGGSSGGYGGPSGFGGATGGYSGSAGGFGGAAPGGFGHGGPGGFGGFGGPSSGFGGGYGGPSSGLGGYGMSSWK